MGVVLDPANSSAPAFPLTVLVTVPSVVEPFLNAALTDAAVKALGSSSKPKVVVGPDSVIVNVVSAEVMATARGVPLSVAGGEPHVDQVPGTVFFERTSENVAVWVPLVRDGAGVLSLPEIARTLVPLV